MDKVHRLLIKKSDWLLFDAKIETWAATIVEVAESFSKVSITNSTSENVKFEYWNFQMQLHGKHILGDKRLVIQFYSSTIANKYFPLEFAC